MSFWDTIKNAITPKTTTSSSTYTGKVGGVTSAATPTYKPSWWESITPWNEQAGETLGSSLKSLTSNIFNKNTTASPVTTPTTTTPKVVSNPVYTNPTVKEDIAVSNRWKTYVQQLQNDPETFYSQNAEQYKAASEAMDPANQPISKSPTDVAVLLKAGLTYDQISKMTAGQAVDYMDKLEREKSYAQGQQVATDYYNTPEAKAQRDAQYIESQQRQRDYYWGDEATTNRQKQYEEQQRRANAWYWSDEEVEQRRKQREESAEWEEMKENEGWSEYYSALEGVKLSPEMDDYFSSPTVFNELRRRWIAEGKKVSWNNFVKNFDYKNNFSNVNFRERMAQAARYSPRMRSASY